MSDKLAALRAQLPAVEHIAFLNTGTCGPLPTVTAEAMRQVAAQEYTEGRASIKRYMQMREDGQTVRTRFGELLHVPPESIALTGHTTEGMNIASFGFNWQPGDEVVTTSLEHEAGLYPLYFIAERYGVQIKFAQIGLGEDPLPAIEAALTPKTRLLSLSHVSYSSGACLPLAEIVAAAHAQGVPVLVDGAQAAGVLDLDLTALGVDFYALPGQKWLCGPEGTGALYVSPAQWENLQPTYAGFTSIAHQDWHGGFELAPAALRYESGTKYPPTITGLRASLDWFLHEVGPAWAYERIAGLAGYARQMLEELDGVRVVTPANRMASLVNFLPVGWSPARMAGLVDVLTERGIVIRSIPHVPYCTRVSCGFYNTEAEIDALGENLRDLLAAGPEAVDIPEWVAFYGVSDEPVW
jgi:L-cysteine/cystine lyase